MNEDINISGFFRKAEDHKTILYTIILASFFISIIYSLTATELFRAKAYMIPPQPKHIQALNVVIGDNRQLRGDDLKSVDVFRVFVINLQSRKYQRKFFFDNKIYEYFNEENYDESFEENFHENLRFSFEEEAVSRAYREQHFLTASFVHTNPEQAAKWLNDYIDMVNRQTSEELANGVNKIIDNRKAFFEGELISKKNLAKKITEDRITQLKEALVIAEKLGITDRDDKGTNVQNVILDEDETMTNQTPLYLIGSKALKAEINVLEGRSSEESFIIGLRQLQQLVTALSSIKVLSSSVRGAEIDAYAVPPSKRFAPRRKMIVFLGTTLGVLISFIYLLAIVVIRRQ